MQGARGPLTVHLPPAASAAGLALRLCFLVPHLGANEFHNTANVIFERRRRPVATMDDTYAVFIFIAAISRFHGIIRRRRQGATFWWGWSVFKAVYPHSRRLTTIYETISTSAYQILPSGRKFVCTFWGVNLPSWWPFTSPGGVSDVNAVSLQTRRRTWWPVYVLTWRVWRRAECNEHFVSFARQLR